MGLIWRSVLRSKTKTSTNTCHLLKIPALLRHSLCKLDKKTSLPFHLRQPEHQAAIILLVHPLIREFKYAAADEYNSVRVAGRIKSLDPPCLEDALPFGDHPYTCSNCASQMRELKDTVRHREYGSCNALENRVGHVGFNKRYAQKGELAEALNNEVDRRKDATKQVSA